MSELHGTVEAANISPPPMTDKTYRARRRAALCCGIGLMLAACLIGRGLFIHWRSGNIALAVFGTWLELVLLFLVWGSIRWFLTAHLDPHVPRRLLVELVSRRMVPRLEKAGFQKMPPDPDRVSKADVDLHRSRADGGQDLVGIHFAKHGRAAFSCMIARVPPAGSTNWQRLAVAAEETRPYQALLRGNVIYRPISLMPRLFWGRFGFTWRLKIDAKPADLDQMQACFEDRIAEMEAWFATPQRSRNISLSDLPQATKA